MRADLKQLLQYAKPHWRRASIAAVAMMIEAAIAAAFTYLMKHMLDDVFVKRDPVVTQWLPWVILALFALRAGAVYLGDLGAAWVARSIVRDLRERSFKHYLRLPSRYFASNPAGPLLSRLTVEIEQLGYACTESFKILLSDGFIVIGLVVVMLLTSVKLTLTVLIVGPLIGLIVGTVSKRFKRLNKNIQDSLADVTTRAQAVIQGEREVKVFGAQAQELVQFRQANEHNFRQQIKVVATNAISTSLVQFLAAGALALVIFVAARSAGSGQALSPGEFMSFISAMLLLLPSLKRLTNVQNLLGRGAAASQSVEALLAVPAEIDQGTQSLSSGPAAIDLRNVSVHYDGAAGPALDRIDLIIAPASTIALVGRSGGGKSTLANVLARFTPINAGQVLINDIDLYDLSLSSLRSQIGWVGQNVVLNADTVIANVGYGQALTEIDEAQVWRALVQANAVDFVRQLPMQLHTSIGANGAMLSGGQRQRIALARALYKKPSMLILDEATSALDNESERAVQQALADLRGQTTLVVIAHRLSTVEHADRIVVMDQGRIVETGTHSELTRAGGLYAQLLHQGFDE
jgi:ATP-binding cassette, subfamily B, bacterial MsbA